MTSSPCPAVQTTVPSSPGAGYTESTIGEEPTAGSDASNALADSADPAVYMSLWDYAATNTLTTNTSISDISATPKKLGILFSGAEPLYWVNTQSGAATTLKFPGLLDPTLQESRLSAYFNNTGARKLDERSFRKTKAIFEIRPLPQDETLYPSDAIDSSHSALNIIKLLQTELEEVRTRGQHNASIHIHKWDREYGAPHDTDTFVVQSEPLFAGIPQPAKAAGFSREALFSGKFKPTSPSKRKATAVSSSSKVGFPPGSIGATISDPYGLYADLFDESPHLALGNMVPPLVLDTNSQIVHPREYPDVLHGILPVVVEVQLRLWDIPPRKGSPTSKAMPGTRTYQLLLKSMQILPYSPPSLSKVQNLNKQGQDDEGGSPSKRRQAGEADLGTAAEELDEQAHPAEESGEKQHPAEDADDDMYD